MNGNEVFAQRNTAHKPLFLLIVKAGQSAVVFLRNARRCEYVVFQLPLCVCKIYHKEGQQKHSLVAAL